MATVRDDNVPEETVSVMMIAYDSAGPAQYLAELRKDAAPQPVGEETIDGVTTTHFRATVDDRRRMRRQLEEGGWEAKNVDAYLAQSDPSELVVDVWVDDAGVARRVRETTESSSTRIVTTPDYSDFGHQEVIVRPPATEAVEADASSSSGRSRTTARRAPRAAASRPAARQDPSGTLGACAGC